MNNQINQLEKIRRLLKNKLQRIDRSINELGLRYDVVDKILETTNDLEDASILETSTTFLMEKGENAILLYEKAKESQKIRKELITLQKIKSSLPRTKFFERNDINNIIAYIISVIENQDCSILHDEVTKKTNYSCFEDYFPCLVVGINEKSILVNENHFPYIVTFLTWLTNYLSYKCFQYGYPLEVLTYEELYNLANVFIDGYQNTKTKKKLPN